MRKQSKKDQIVIFVLLANSFFNDPRVKQEVETLLKYNFNIYVLAWDRNGKENFYKKDSLIVKTIKIISLKEFHKIAYLISAIFFQLLIIIHGLKLLVNNQKVIVHANDFNTLLGAVLLKILSSKTVRIVYDSHELTPAVYEEWFSRVVGIICGSIEKLLLKFVDKIITVSPPIAEYLKRITNNEIKIIYNYPQKKYIPRYTKEQAREELNIEKNVFVICYIGSLRQDLSLEDLIYSVKLLNEKKTRRKICIYIVGNGTLFNRLKDLIRKHNLSTVVYMIGKIPREKAMQYLRASDLSYVVFNVKGLNTKIGLPWKLFESILCDTKVLVKCKTYAAEFVTKNKLGYCISETKPAKIAETIEYLAEMKEDLFENKNNSTLLLWEKQEYELYNTYKAIINT